MKFIKSLVIFVASAAVVVAAPIPSASKTLSRRDIEIAPEDYLGGFFKRDIEIAPEDYLGGFFKRDVEIAPEDYLGGFFKRFLHRA